MWGKGCGLHTGKEVGSCFDHNKQELGLNVSNVYSRQQA